MSNEKSHKIDAIKYFVPLPEGDYDFQEHLTDYLLTDILNANKQLEKYEARVKELEEKLKRKTQECEELKERLVRTEEDLKYQCVDCMNVKSDRYREALEKIEKVINNILNSCLGRNTVSCRPAHNVCGDLINILGIISRAKGEK